MAVSRYRQTSFSHRALGAGIVISCSTGILGLILLTVVSSRTDPEFAALVITGVFIAFAQTAIGLGLFFNTTWGTPVAKLMYGSIFFVSFSESFFVPGVLSLLILLTITWGDPDTR